MEKKIANILLDNSVQLFVQVVAVSVVIFNLWLASKLSPLAQDIAVINNRIEAVETEHDKIKASSEIIIQNATRIQNIEKQLDRIEYKIDNK